MQISASLSVDDRNVLSRSTETKPDTADGMDKRISLLTIDLAADPSDIYVNNVGHGIKMEIPYVLQQHGPGNNLAFVANQILEYLKFARQQFDVSATPAHCARHQVDLKIADTQHRL